MNEFVKNLMTEEEFNSINVMDREKIEKYAEFYKDKFNWTFAIHYCGLMEDTLRKFADRLNWNEVSISQKNMSPEFIEDFKDKLVWSDLSQYNMFNRDQLIEYVDYIDWDRAPIYQIGLNEKVVEAILASPAKNKLNWHNVIVHVKFSEDFLEKHYDEITKAGKWEIVSYYQPLSEKFILKHADVLNWNYISQKQVLSREFMVKYFNKINKTCAKQYQRNWDNMIEKDALKFNANPENKNEMFFAELKTLMNKYDYDMNTVKQIINN